ncbi:MAG: trypsin-like peptidase domain-containing protein [Bryobacteraceae bacterium]|nr:trypsin-like peptidase domain-containing protein [Bryobacteraceae bacterium]
MPTPPKVNLLGTFFIASLFFQSLQCGFSQSFDAVEIAKNLSPAVVLLRGATIDGTVLGSGFIISSDGKIATNLHVIREFRTGTVRLSSGEEFTSFSILAFDEKKDLAIIKVAGSMLPSVRLGNSDDVQVGEPVLIMGNPLGLQGSVTTGVISAIRDDPFGGAFKTLQTDAAISPGNSGGPVVNRRQEVIGIVDFMIVGGTNLNFALPVNYLRNSLDSAVSEISLEDLRLKLGSKPTAAGTSPPVQPSKTPLAPRIPNWWFTADPKKVLADPLFPTLSIEERTKILIQIDQKFAKMSIEKRNGFLWGAETDYLPKAANPKEVITWNAGDANCSTEFDTSGSLKKIITADGIKMTATFEDAGFLKSHLRIVNTSNTILQIFPQTFVVNVIKPKQYTLFYEYPNRVSHEQSMKEIRLSGLYHTRIDTGFMDYVFEMERESMKPGPLLPGMAVEGHVWFEISKYARDVVLRVSIGDRAFDIPFTIERSR